MSILRLDADQTLVRLAADRVHDAAAAWSAVEMSAALGLHPMARRDRAGMIFLAAATTWANAVSRVTLRGARPGAISEAATLMRAAAETYIAAILAAGMSPRDGEDLAQRQVAILTREAADALDAVALDAAARLDDAARLDAALAAAG